MRLLNLLHREQSERRFWVYLAGRDTPLSASLIRDLRRVFLRSRGQCAYCGRRRGYFEPDHITPLIRGGPNVVANQILACRGCNRAKNHCTAAEAGRPDLQVFEPTTSLDVFRAARRANLPGRTPRHAR